MHYSGLDLHKKSAQVALIDEMGNKLLNKKVKNDFPSIKKLLSTFPNNAKYVMESSSVWYGLFRYMTDVLHLDVVLSNPYNTKIIATSLKKTDKIDAFHLANLLRGGYIAESYVPNKKIVEYRQLVRSRNKIVQINTKLKNSIHGITLQAGIKTKAHGFTQAHIMELNALKDYRIDMYLEMIESNQSQIAKLNRKITRIASTNQDIQLLKTIPGIGDYTATVLVSEIAKPDRFPDSHKLVAYAGMVPSVRNSADTVHHGRITKRGSSILRHVIVEAAHSHLQHAPNSKISEFYKRLAKKRGASKAIVATAAKLLRVSHRILIERKAYDPHYT